VRLTANGEDWKVRAALTQPLFAKYSEKLDDQKIEEIYLRHLKNFFTSQSDDLFQALTDAAMEVIFLVFNLPAQTAWPSSILNQVRENLCLQQFLVWGNESQDQFSEQETKLQFLCHEIINAWAAEEGMSSFIASLQDKLGSAEVDIAKELIQVFQAASETTASTLLWSIDCLLRYPEIRKRLINDDKTVTPDLFLKEVLRLFPPLPFVTRSCSQETQVDGLLFKRDEVILISLIGLHTHPLYWSEPLAFKPDRSEFVNNSFNKSAYIPFLSGPRACGGMRLATQEILVALKVILNLCDFEPTSEPLTITYGVTSRPGAQLTPYLKLRT